MADAHGLRVTQFPGLDKRSHQARLPVGGKQGGPAPATAIQNVNLAHGDLRPRPASLHTNCIDDITSLSGKPVAYEFLFEKPDGTVELVWVQTSASGDLNLYAKSSPDSVGASIASSTNIDSALSDSTYPFKWGRVEAQGRPRSSGVRSSGSER